MLQDDLVTPQGSRGRVRRLGIIAAIAAAALGGCVSRASYQQVVAENRALTRQVAEMQTASAGQVAQIIRLQNAIKYTVNSDLAFPPGKWEMSQEGRDVIGKFAWQLAGTQRSRLYVTGYTDNAPVGPDLVRAGVTSNEILSQRRAENVARFLVEQGVNPDLLTVKGMGESNPVASNATPQGRAQNRRVEITLAPPVQPPSP